MAGGKKKNVSSSMSSTSTLTTSKTMSKRPTNASIRSSKTPMKSTKPPSKSPAKTLLSAFKGSVHKVDSSDKSGTASRKALHRQEENQGRKLPLAKDLSNYPKSNKSHARKTSFGSSLSGSLTFLSTYTKTSYPEKRVIAKKSIDKLDLSKLKNHGMRIGAITDACVEFDHYDETLHAIELKLGAAHFLCDILSNTSHEDEIRMICAALEMVYRASHDAVEESFNLVGNALVPLLLRLLERCESGTIKNADVSIVNISKVLLYFARVPPLRSTLARHQGLLRALQRVSTSILNSESRVTRLRILANLANANENKVIISEYPGLLDSVLNIAHLDLSKEAKEYAAAALMDLTNSPLNQANMAKNDKMIAVVTKLSLFDDEKDETREFAITALQNLAFAKENRKTLITFGNGMVLEALKKNLMSNPRYKGRRRAAGTITNLVTAETAEALGNHQGLLEALAIVSKKDGNEEVRERAMLTLTKIAYGITSTMKCHSTLLDALIAASAAESNEEKVSTILRSKTKIPENRTNIAHHDGILNTLAKICTSLKATTKGRENAMKSIMHLTSVQGNRKIMATKAILDATIHCANLTGVENESTRDSAMVTLERLGTEITNRKAMACHEGLITVVAMATEREAKAERKGDDPQAERLAKPLLMSLLLAL